MLLDWVMEQTCRSQRVWTENREDPGGLDAKSELATQFCDQDILNGGERSQTDQVYHLGHCKAAETAGIDAPEGFQIHRDVERETMERTATTDAQAQGRNLCSADIDARCTCVSQGGDVPSVQRVDLRLLDAAHEFAHANLQRPQVEQRIRDDLTRPVIGHLSTAIDRNDRYVTRRQYMLGKSGLAEREIGSCSTSHNSSGVSVHRASVNACIACQTGS